MVYVMPTLLHVSAHIAVIALADVEPNQLYNVKRLRMNVQHTALTQAAGLCIQYN